MISTSRKFFRSKWRFDWMKEWKRFLLRDWSKMIIYEKTFGRWEVVSMPILWLDFFAFDLNQYIKSSNMLMPITFFTTIHSLALRVANTNAGVTNLFFLWCTSNNIFFYTYPSVYIRHIQHTTLGPNMARKIQNVLNLASFFD